MTPIQQSPTPLPAREAIVLSEDARLVQAIRAGVSRTSYRGDAFPLLKRERPEWTRERWDEALAELEQARTLAFGDRHSIWCTMNETAASAHFDGTPCSS